MEYLSKEELESRINDVFRNSLTLTNKGQIGLRQPNGEGGYWMMLWTHVLEELGMRGEGVPAANTFLSKEVIPKTTWPEMPAAVKALNGKDFEDKAYLFKYGEKKYLREMFSKGRIKVSPATFYKDASLNSAIRDDESIIEVYSHPSHVTITHVDPKTGKNTEIHPIGNVKTSFETKTNYYAYCMSFVYDPRLFDDFGYDSCVVIKKPKKMLDKINAQFKEVGRWAFITDKVSYLDPLNPPHKDDINLFFNKHFRYSYQKEVRIIWVPEEPILQLEPLNFEIGSMASYAEYLEL